MRKTILSFLLMGLLAAIPISRASWVDVNQAPIVEYPYGILNIPGDRTTVLLIKASDPQGDEMALVPFGKVCSGGTIQADRKNFRFLLTPPEGFRGENWGNFSFAVQDSKGLCNLINVLVNVYDPENPPIWDLKPPVITTGPRASFPSKPESYALTIHWVTDEQTSTNELEWGADVTYGNSIKNVSTMGKSHYAYLPGPVVPGESYHYRIRSRDIEGNWMVSHDFSFKVPMDLNVPAVAMPQTPPEGAFMKRLQQLKRS